MVSQIGGDNWLQSSATFPACSPLRFRRSRDSRGSYQRISATSQASHRK